MSIYAIGDVQGCFQQLEQLLIKINFNEQQDRLWFAGDIVNRGPQSLQTLRYIKSLGDKAITVLGNHDLHLLAVANGSKKQNKKDTLKNILQADDRDELLDWLRHRPLIHYDEQRHLCLVHAGIYPWWSITQALNYAAEVEDVLQNGSYQKFFQHMYGNKPNKWSEQLSDWDRLRFITNVFTRMRYCDEQGHLHLQDKGKPGNQADGVLPWFNFNKEHSSSTQIIFGHWSTLTNPKQQNLYPLDTGCLWGGRLTALKIDQQPGDLFYIDCPQA